MIIEPRIAMRRLPTSTLRRLLWHPLNAARLEWNQERVHSHDKIFERHFSRTHAAFARNRDGVFKLSTPSSAHGITNFQHARRGIAWQNGERLTVSEPRLVRRPSD